MLTGTLTTLAWTPTGNQGEYTFDSGVYTNVSDFSGSGAYLVTVGSLVYTPAIDVATAMPIPGVMHCYKLTQVAILDNQTLSGTILWNEIGLEQDSPQNGATSVISEASPNHKYGYAVSELLYPSLPTGASTAILNIDTKEITDNIVSSPDTFSATFSATDWATEITGTSKSLQLTHNLGTTDIHVSTFVSAGANLYSPTFLDWVLGDSTIKLLIADTPNSPFSGKVDLQII